MEVTDERWILIKDQFEIGDAVTGVVVHKSPFGDWIDIGAGCSCLLEIIVMKDLTPEIYRSGEYNPVGSTVKATIVGFRDENKQIYLSQTL